MTGSSSETAVEHGAELQGGALIPEGVEIPVSVLGDEMLSRASFSDAANLPKNPDGLVPASPPSTPMEAADFIFSIMKSDARSEVQAKGCQALAQIAENPEGRSALLAVDTIAIVVEAMMSAADDEVDLQARGCAALSNLVIGGEGEVAILKQGGLAAVLAAGKAHPAEAAVQRKCCTALGNIAFGSAGEAAVLEAGGLDVVVAAMKAHPTDEGLQEDGVDALVNIADSDAGKQQLLAIGGLGVVAAAKKLSKCAESAASLASGLVNAAKAMRE